MVLLVERSPEPEHGKWGLSDGIVNVDVDEDIKATALRKLSEKTSVAPLYLDQLASIGNRSRDPRGWYITVCYSALMAHQDCEHHVSNVPDVR